MELISRSDELKRLQRAGAGLATLDSAMASLLMVKAYSKKELDKIESQISRIERDPAHLVPTRWHPNQPEFKAGFEMLRKRYITRCA